MKVFVIRILANFFRFVPTFSLEFLAFSTAVALLIFHSKIYRKILNNHRFVYPEKSEKELQRISQRSLKTFVQNQLFSLKMMKKKSIARRFAVSGEGLDELKATLEHSAVILVVPHLSVNYLPVVSLAKAMQRQVIVPIRGTTHEEKVERKIYKYLSDDWVKMQLLGGAMEEIERVVANKGIVVLALDAVLPIKHKLEVNFFGSRFAMSSGALWLAEKFSLPVFSVCSILHKQKMRVQVERLDWQPPHNPQQKMSQIAGRLESYIRSNPGFWNLDDDLFALATSS